MYRLTIPFQGKLPFFLLLSLLFASSLSHAVVGNVQFNSISTMDNVHCTEETVSTSNGDWVYSISFCDHTINIFQRQFDGTLTLVDSMVNQDDQGNRLEGDGISPNAVLLISPNDQNLYVYGHTYAETNQFHSAIFAYDIDQETGLLSLRQIFDDITISGSISEGIISQDGNNIYLSSTGETINVISRAGNGQLSLLGTVNINELSESGTRLFRVNDLELDPTGSTLYVSTDKNHFLWLNRNESNGSLTLAGELTGDGDDYISMSEFTVSSVSSDIYGFSSPSSGSDGVVHLRVDEAGDVSVVSIVDELIGTHLSDRLFCPVAPKVSANGRLLYFIDSCVDDIQVWGIDSETGEVSFFRRAEENGSDFETHYFSQANNLIFSPDGQYLYGSVNSGVTVMDVTVDTQVDIDLPETLTPESNFTIDAMIENTGVSSAHRVQVEIDLGALSVSGATITGIDAQCEIEANAVTCEKFEMNPGEGEVITLQVSTPASTTTTISASVSQDQLDNDSDNNTFSQQVSIGEALGDDESSDSTDESDDSSDSSGGSIGNWSILVLMMMLMTRLRRREK